MRFFFMVIRVCELVHLYIYIWLFYLQFVFFSILVVPPTIQNICDPVTTQNRKKKEKGRTL